MQSPVMPQKIVCPSVRLSVCLSVTLSYDFHTGLNTSKTISRPNSLRLLHELTPIWAIWCNGNTPKIGWNSCGVTQEHKNLQYLRNGVRYDQGYYDGSRIRAFDWYQNQRPWMTLNGVSKGCQVPPIISGTGKATDFKFGRYIHGVYPNKSPLKILEKRERGPIQQLPNVFKYPLLSQKRVELQTFMRSITTKAQ